MPVHTGVSRASESAAQRPSRRAFDHGGDRPPSSAPFVIVVSDDAARAAVLSAAAGSAGVTARWVRHSAPVTELRRTDDCGIAIVSVDDGAKAGSTTLDSVAVLKRKGYTVLCCWQAAGPWPLDAQCRVLVVGAAHLLTTSEPSFRIELADLLTRLLEADRERRAEDSRLRAQMLALGVVGASPAIMTVFRRVQRVGVLSDLAVLVAGETGTGKELVARAIHALDPRRHVGPFVAVNCCAISAGLAESELFGHRRGAFTGAIQDRRGLIRAAHGGVLFLDEIGDLDATVQGKLLRVLQERRVLAVGEDREVPVDVRIIAATNRDLERMVERQTFRADLFHRLNVLSLHLPALRERPDDIAPLVHHFIAQCAVGTPEVRTAGDDFIQALRRLALPGNVRQVENVVRRAVFTATRGDTLGLCDLPPELLAELAELAPPVTPPHLPEAPPAPAIDLIDPIAVLEATNWKLEAAVELCEQKLVAAALTASHGNRSRAARLLGISPRCMFNKMRRHRLTA